MTPNEKAEIIKLIGACWESQGRQISEGALILITEDLSDFNLIEVKSAINECRKKGFLVNAGNVIPFLAKVDGRPEANEAWALSLAAMDESKTVVWTDEMAQAWGAAQPLFQYGDKTGARMAFKESYERAVEENRKINNPVNCWVSYGFDVQGRIEAIEHASTMGLIQKDVAQELISKQGAGVGIGLSKLKDLARVQ